MDEILSTRQTIPLSNWKLGNQELKSSGIPTKSWRLGEEIVRTKVYVMVPRVKLSDGAVVDPLRLTKVILWGYPARLEIDLENDPRVVIYGENASKDADLLEKIHDDYHLKFSLLRM